ncbi:enoyl-CoA hydratase [Candidatus Poriferisocius sp.]|uniref:enoyl-CoA hydratase n=1 Tax=Candidatus Poriferisocius sp. TaxID=3101276 RepID=UPI003B59A778
MADRSDTAVTPEELRLLVQVGERIATIALNRPEARNAMTKRMRNDLCAALRSADADDGVDAIILTGTDPVFTGGVDLREVAADGASGNLGTDKRQAEDPAQACRDTAKPLIAAVNGTCVTGGLEIALSCDFIVASEQARFADTHAKIGVIPAWGMSALLPRAVGKRMAKEMSATARFVPAEEALRIGMVNHVVPHQELSARARALAHQIVAATTPATGATMALYDDGEGLSFADAKALEDRVMGSWTVDTDDMARRGLGPPAS